MTIELNGRITEKGKLLERTLRIEPLTGAEIVAAGLVGGWEDKGISSGAEWVAEQRRRRREQRSY